MSKLQENLYAEDLARAEQDLQDAQESYEHAQEETRNAFLWEEKMKANVVECQTLLEKIKNND